MNDIHDIIGTDYRSINLKPINKRIRNRRIKAEMRQPDVALIITSKNKKYKLLKVEDSNNRRYLHIRKMLDLLSAFDFVPRIIWSDDHKILVEYIDGKYPDFGVELFAREIGKHLSKLHSINVGTIDADDYFLKIEKNLEYLVSKKALSFKRKSILTKKLSDLKPDVLRTSMVYANMHNPKNYVFSKDNKLYFIDLGSFQVDRVTDDVLFGYRIFKSLDENTFWESYFKNGGTNYIYDNRLFLKLAQHINKAAKHLHGHHKKPVYDLWQKRRSYKRFQWMRNELIAEMDNF